MTSFAELLDDVYTITNRSDLVAETKLAVRSATLRAHHSDFYSKDLFESGLEFDTKTNIQQLFPRELFPRYRALKYFRIHDGTQPMQFLDVITPEEVLDGYKLTRNNVCYEAGLALNLRSATDFQFALIGMYLNPVITEEGYSSWIADSYPFAIVYEAASTIFKMTGELEQVASSRQMSAEFMAELKNSNIVANGY
jgi:hypothetical protein